MKKLAIIGSSDLAKQIAHFAPQCNYKFVGYFDDFKNKGIDSIVGTLSDIQNLYEDKVFDEIMVGVGYGHMAFRKEIFLKVKKQNIPFATMIHPSCIIDKTAVVGKGTILYPGCIIDQQVEIRENVLLNLGCIISHNSIVHSHSFFAPAVTVSGFCKIGEQCNIGINTTIIDNIIIGKNIQTGGGALVTENIEQPGLYYGVPARYKK